MSMNPPRKPDPLATRATKAARGAIRGQEVAIGIVIGFMLALLGRVVGG